MRAQIVRKGSRRRRGQGMTEYIIIVGLIAIALVVAVGKLKTALNNAYEKSSTELQTQVVDQIGQR